MLKSCVSLDLRLRVGGMMRYLRSQIQVLVLEVVHAALRSRVPMASDIICSPERVSEYFHCWKSGHSLVARLGNEVLFLSYETPRVHAVVLR